MITKPRYFELTEFIDSSTARQKSIQNAPTWDVVEHLNDLALFLDDIREAWGSAIKVTSGFRCKKLNDAVGGVPNSGHLYGFAADIVPANGDIKGFEAFLRRWLPTYENSWDECLFESRGKTKWVHISMMSASGGKRRKMFGISVPV